MFILVGSDSVSSASSFHTYDYPAAAVAPSSAPPWYDPATGRANVYLNPNNIREYRGPARGYTLITDGSITVMTSSGDQETQYHEAGEGFGVQFTAILASTSAVKVFW